VRRWAGRQLRRSLGLFAGLLLVLWRLSCRRRIVDDPRPGLRAAKTPYILALLHGQQLAAVLLSDEPQLAAMLSRSADGDLLAPALRLRRVLPVRGSSRNSRRDKGGLAALRALQDHMRQGHPSMLAVDGPRGPYGHVGRGILVLARRTGAVILPVAAHASSKWVLSRRWDRFEVPGFGSTLTLRFAAPMLPPSGPEEDLAARQALSDCLQRL
jgi:lysophospholipid acyltransferase (LPLAT)-like uncharacterized protein